MIVSRDRPVEEVQRNLVQQGVDDDNEDERILSNLTRYGRRTTTQDAVLPVIEKPLTDVISGDFTERKQRLLRTLEGNQLKGTVVIACRGTADSTDTFLDLKVFSSSTVNNLKKSPEYQEVKEHALNVLKTFFSANELSPTSYRRNWDVYATGHSLGGAMTDQLILDGVAKGGVTFAAPRTVDSKFSQPSYGIINSQDAVIGRALGQSDSPYDLVVEGSKPLLSIAGYPIRLNPLQHSMKLLAPSITATTYDRYPKFNNKRFKPSTREKEFNLMTGNGVESSTGAGRAPVLSSFYEAANNVYDKNAERSYRQSLKNFLNEGLLLPELTLFRSNKAIVQFYVFATPTYDYNEMPVRRLIEQHIRELSRGENVDDVKLAMILNNF